MIFRPSGKQSGDGPPAQTSAPMGRVAQRRSRWLTLLVSVAAISSFGGVIYWAHRQDIKAGGDGIVPLIRADGKPTKAKPGDPGGMVVPHQDKDVYNRLNPSAAPGGPEKLLPPAPTPQIPPANPPQAMPAPQPPADPPPANAPQNPPAPAPQATNPPPANPPAQNPPVQNPPAQNPPQAGPSIANLIDSISKYRIQLASVKSEEQAQATFARLQKAHPDVLGGLSLQAQRVELGDRGIFYRVQAGPLDDGAAQAACAKLKSRSVDCIVIKP